MLPFIFLKLYNFIGLWQIKLVSSANNPGSKISKYLAYLE